MSDSSILEQFRKIKKRRKELNILIVFFIVLFVYEWINPDFTLFGVPVWVYEFLLFALFGFIVLNEFKNWKCPACGVTLGKEMNLKFCSKCGVKLQDNL